MPRRVPCAITAALFLAFLPSSGLPQEIPIITNVADVASLGHAAWTNWMARMVPPGPHTFRNDLGLVCISDETGLTNLAAVVDGAVTTHPLKMIETTSSPLTRLVLDAADRVAITSAPPAGYTPWSWMTNTYGSPGVWLSGDELEQWKRDRAPTRQHVALILIGTSAVPAYLAQLTNSVPNEPSGHTNASMLALYSNDIAFVGLGTTPLPGVLLHAPTNVPRLDVFASADLLASRGGWTLVASRDRTSDPLYLSLGALGGVLGLAGGNASLDTDGDGIADVRESMLFGSDPYAFDSDFDSISDRDEIFRYGTNPFNADSDHDGNFDGDEVAARTNPANSDTDGDGLTDHEETFFFFTDPLLYDSDGDLLSDYAEVNSYETYPLHADTDEDGLTDYEEIVLGTDPHLADSDGDGMDDLHEEFYGLDPTEASDAMDDEDGDGLNNLVEYQWVLSPIYSNGYSYYQRLIACGPGPNAIREIDTPNHKMAVGDCGPATGYLRVRPFKQGSSLVPQKLVHSRTPGIFINGVDASTLASPIEIPAQSASVEFAITASKAVKGQQIEFKLTNDVVGGGTSCEATFHVPKLLKVDFLAAQVATTVNYDMTGTLNVALSSDTNACRIFLREYPAYTTSGYGIPIPHFSDWLRVRVLGPSPEPTNATLNYYDYRAAFAISYSQARTRGIHVSQPGQYCIQVGFDMDASGTLEDEEVEETCLVNVLRVSVAWEAIDSPLDTNPNAGGGLRIFPDKASPTDTTDRSKVRLRATVTPTTANVAVHFKVFDVDDTTPTSFEHGEIDTNLSQGDDNFGAPKTGVLATNVALTDANGQATVVLTVPMQPGDNLRAAASTFPYELSRLTVAATGSSYYVRATNAPMPTFAGGLTDVLTVWRRLWLEFDSMGPVATNGAEMNFDRGSIAGLQTDVPTVGLSTLDVGTLLNDEADRYLNGFIELGDGTRYVVRSNTDNLYLSDTVVIAGVPPDSIVGQPFAIHDDDYDIATGALRRPMPYGLSGGALLTNAFGEAYILPTHVPVQYVDLNAPFVRNLPSGYNNFSAWSNAVVAHMDLAGSTNFWYTYLLACWQGGVSTDLDPDVPTIIAAESRETLNAGSIYVEALREEDMGSPLDKPRLNEEHSVVHEIGHHGGGSHADAGLMDDGAPSWEDRFAPVTIRRFRSEASF